MYHPFKVINFTTSAYIPFYITNIDRIALYYPEIKKRHLTYYYELFYNFGWYKRKSNNTKFCRICHHRVNKSITQHVLCDCTKLSFIRQTFFTKVHNALLDLYNHKTDIVHQRLFAFHVLQLLENVNQNETFWKIICGMNFYDTETNSI